MPAPNQKVADISEAQRQAFNRMTTPAAPVVASVELAELRKEIAEMKALLTPSIILTGQRVIEEYWNLTTPKR